MFHIYRKQPKNNSKYINKLQGSVANKYLNMAAFRSLYEVNILKSLLFLQACSTGQFHRVDLPLAHMLLLQKKQL
jgi:hypothetical protein